MHGYLHSQGVIMNLTLDYLKSNRKWLVPNIVVWGNADSYQPNMLLTEDGDTRRVIFASAAIGGKNQSINYEDLIDSRGNSLPDEIQNPVIVIIPRNAVHCHLIGRPSSTGFKIARAESYGVSSTDGLVDLLIMEVDLP
jgi:hypothetical protein